MNKFLGNIRLTPKMLINPFIVILFQLILGWVAYTSLSNQKNGLEDIYKNRFQKYQISAAILKDVSDVHANMYKIVSWLMANASITANTTDVAADSNTDIKNQMGALGATQIKVLERIKELLDKTLKTESLDREERKLYETVKEYFTEYQPVASNLAYATKSGSIGALGNLAMVGNLDQRYQALNGSLNALLSFENKLSQERYDFSLAGFNSSLRIYLILLGTVIMISIFLSIFLSKMIAAPIHQSITAIKQIAEGDLTQEVQELTRDEIGELTEAINTMRLKMGKAVGQSIVMSRGLSEAASAQAVSLEETASSLEEMTSMTRHNSENARQANQLMALAHEVIEKADGSMRELTGSMREIAQASEETQKIVKSIDGIAFQTNLLALNAAVEAARAGEAGAGFAVVADEVRNLAMRAAEAARNTSELMEDIVRKIRNGENLVGVTDAAFEKVKGSSSKVVQLIAEISQASQEQSQGIDQLNRAMFAISSVTQQNAGEAEKLASVMALFKTNEHGFPDLDFQESGPRQALTMISSGGSGEEKDQSALTAKEIRPDQPIPLEAKEFNEF